ncbi:acyl-CoA thioesterase [Aquimarina brevivitae]|uniref:Acyl-CoA thioester hydrolase n=1 Tax=Aquimarina brevivitae TaxID=323412 RepID=A0A4Q7P1R0_9FLAO|nr:acyl-CoA thioesterase [Aquimarina brevivitae]RZS92582.1 acyl-CoA thioester hydrolase [Aquimarina brevivitae]
MELPKILESKTKIRFQDCDPFNHLNNASYLNYMINAREDQIDEFYNIDIFSLAKNEGVSWVVGTNQIAYLKPALVMETVVIESQLIHCDQHKLWVEIRMLDESKKQLKAVQWSTFVHFNLLKQQKWVHSEELMSVFKQVEAPVDASNFEDRIQQLKLQKV